MDAWWMIRCPVLNFKVSLPASTCYTHIRIYLLLCLDYFSEVDKRNENMASEEEYQQPIVIHIDKSERLCEKMMQPIQVSH